MTAEVGAAGVAGASGVVGASGVHWYCIRTKRFNERACAAIIQAELGKEVFCPMLSYERARSSGKAWVTEALFPNYLFSRFDYVECWRHIRAIRGVLKIVGFGDQPLPVPEAAIAELKAFVQEKETIVIPSRIAEGDEVTVLEGPFRGLRTLVTRVLPSKDRVAILLEILGAEREVEIQTSAVLTAMDHPLTAATPRVFKRQQPRPAR